MPSIQRIKHFCFTLNNYNDEEITCLQAYLQTSSNYSIYGKEVGESGTPHLQGYCSLSKQTGFASIKGSFNSRAHLEPAKGTAEQNRVYCSKGGDIWEYGTCPESNGTSKNKRTRDELAISFTKCAGRGLSGLAEYSNEFPGVYAWSGSTLLRNYLSLRPPIARPNINVQWFYGPPGTGKSREAHETFPNAFIKDPRTKWWNGYLLEEEVIIDDFGPGGIDINHLLRWFDRYKCLVENKGGMIPLYATSIIVTSNFHPEKLFSTSYVHSFGEDACPHPQLPALMRRLSIKEFI